MAISQESIIGYLDFYEDFKKFCTNGILRYKDLKSAFDRRNKNALHLCAFNKRFDSLLNHSNRDEILEYVRHLPHIFNRPRLHLKQIEEVRPAAIVTRIGPESIRHLASHSEHWKGIKANGLVPERLLARILEDDYAIYENIAAKTLVDKLYAMEKAEYEDIIDFIMNSQSVESLLNGSHSKFYEAMSFLRKGYEEKESSTVHQLQDKARKTIGQILSYLTQCKSTPLYRKIKKEKDIRGQLKRTNIFMMDNYYKNVYHLWSILGQKEETSEFQGKKELDKEYFVYTELVILFSLQYLGFICDDNEPILKKDCFDNLELQNENWIVKLNSILEGKNRIIAEIRERKSIKINFQNIDLPESTVYADYNCVKQGNSLLFKRKILDNEQKILAKKISEKMDKKIQNDWSKKFQKTLFDEMKKVSVKTEHILFIPWKYDIPDNYEEAKESIQKLQAFPYEDEFNECYILNITRPNELKNITDEALLNALVSFSQRNQNSNKEKFVGIIPVGLNDVYSFMRISKVFLKSMILLQNEQKFCPQCCATLHGNMQTGYTCPDCGLRINNTQCPDCKKRYWYTDYVFPKTLTFEIDSPGLKILMKETNLGFRNITQLEVTTDGRHKPICPYCEEKTPRDA